jgi:CHAT domain-containing protein
LLVLGLLLPVVTGCKRSSALSPEQIYQDSRLKLKRGDLKDASTESDTALRTFSSPDTDWHWRFTVLLGEIQVRQGRYKEALALLEPDLPSSFARSDLAVWRRLSQGAANCFLLQFGEAERFLQQAEALARENHPDLLGEVALRMGTLADLRGDREAAKSAYRATLRMARDQKDSFLEASALGSLGLVATEEEHYDEAIDWNRAALQLSESVGARDSIAFILGNMGLSYFELGDYETALSLFERADKSSEKLGAVSAQLDWKTDIGDVYFEQHNLGAARSAYESALVLARSIDDQTAITKCFGNLAFVDLETGQLDSASHYHDEVVQFVRAHPDHFLDQYSSLIAARIEEGKHNYAQAEQLFRTVLKDPRGETALRWEAEARLGEAYVAEGKGREAEREFRHSLETIKKARSSVKAEEFRLSFLSSAISFYNDYIDFLISQGRSNDALEIADLSRAQTLAEGLAPTSTARSIPLPDFHPQRIARRMGATLLFYWLGQQRSYLWAVTARGSSLFILPPATEIDPLVRSYREALVGPRDVLETENAVGQKLYELLVAPAQELIPRGSHVVILPDGSLYGLNFETLLVPAPRLHYWIEDVVVANANSLLLLAGSVLERRERPRGLLLIGDPVSPDSEYPALPQAASEMTGIEKHFPPSEQTILAGNRATAEAYLDSRPGQFSFIHFVAHGTASRTSPLDSAVILTRQGDSYKLYARDIIKQPLHADLVTISACHGAGVRTYSGEGLVGLIWAFLRAGAHSVVAALWEVNDNSTPKLMDQLYAEISTGASVEVALRDAKFTLLHSGSVYRKPFYWAPFQVYRGL